MSNTSNTEAPNCTPEGLYDLWLEVHGYIPAKDEHLEERLKRVAIKHSDFANQSIFCSLYNALERAKKDQPPTWAIPNPNKKLASRILDDVDGLDEEPAAEFLSDIVEHDIWFIHDTALRELAEFASQAAKLREELCVANQEKALFQGIVAEWEELTGVDEPSKLSAPQLQALLGVPSRKDTGVIALTCK